MRELCESRYFTETPCVNKGDNSEILVQCDIGATEAGTEADAFNPLSE